MEEDRGDAADAGDGVDQLRADIPRQARVERQRVREEEGALLQDERELQHVDRLVAVEVEGAIGERGARPEADVAVEPERRIDREPGRDLCPWRGADVPAKEMLPRRRERSVGRRLERATLAGEHRRIE